MEIKKGSAPRAVFAYVGSGINVDVLKLSHEKGLFKKHGVEMSLMYFSTGPAATQAVATGSASAGTAPATDALQAISKGGQMKIVMVNIDRFDHCLVVKGGIKNPGDLKGKKIAVSRHGSFSDIETRSYLVKQKIDPDKEVQYVELGNAAARAAALSSGAVDAALVTWSFVPMAKKAGFSVLFDMSMTPTKVANRCVIAADRLIQGQPEVVKAIVAGFVEGTRYWKAHPEEAKPYLKKVYKLDDADVDHFYTETGRLIRSAPTPDADSIRNAWDSTPELKAQGTVDLKKVVEARFAREVLTGIK